MKTANNKSGIKQAIRNKAYKVEKIYQFKLF